MTVITERTSPDTSGSGLPPVRLSLKPQGPQSGLLDGAWWPRSRDLAGELPALISTLDPLWGRITRVTVNPTHWAGVPAKVPVAGRVVKAGWFTEQDPHKLLLLSYRVGRWDLLVIPPQVSEDAAARLMTAATDPQTVRTASELLAEEGAEEGPERAGHAAPAAPADDSAPVKPTEAWEDEGAPCPRRARHDRPVRTRLPDPRSQVQVPDSRSQVRIPDSRPRIRTMSGGESPWRSVSPSLPLWRWSRWGCS